MVVEKDIYNETTSYDLCWKAAFLSLIEYLIYVQKMKYLIHVQNMFPTYIYLGRVYIRLLLMIIFKKQTYISIFCTDM